MNMNRRFHAAAVGAMLALLAGSACAASIALGQATTTGITATITPDASETGTLNVYMGARYNGQWYLRNGAADWRAQSSGALPVAGQISVSGGKPVEVSVTALDISSLVGLEVHIAYGLTEADIRLPGHLTRIYTVPATPTQRAVLRSFAGSAACTDLENYIEDTAVAQMRSQLEAARDGLPGWGGWRGPWPIAVADGTLVLSAQATAAASPAPADFTTTNTQVAGVDEADFVKNDGTRIFTLSGERLYAARSWPPPQLQVLGTLRIEGYPRELFLDGQDRAVVFSTIYEPYPLAGALRVRCLSLDCGYSSANTIKITVVDVSDMANLRVVREVFLPGSYQSARKIGSSVRIVLSDSFRYPPEMKWYPAYDPVKWSTKEGQRAAYDSLIAENEVAIRSRTLDEWLPPAKLTVAGVSTSLPQSCTDFARVSAPTQLGLASVVTLNLAAGSVARTTIMAETGQIYASANNLYLATGHWWSWPAIGQEDSTYIHKFDITQPSQAVYLASGTVPGHIVDQFSLDESASGHLRVVTTVDRRVPDTQNPQNTWGTITTVNRLSVLAQERDALTVVGSSPDLAKGERVMSSRIIGDKGFVVTFRQIDPLFTFDLSDPTSPRVVAELKIPGFSTYMHPLDANHLLTIGTFIPEPVAGQPVNWQARALQLAIFDVSDLAAPRQTHVKLVGTAYGWSEAQSEHRAFNYFAAKKLLAIPFSDWDVTASGSAYWSAFTSDLRVYSVDAATGFTARGALSMRDLYQSAGVSGWLYYWQPSVRRSVMADDFVYAISDAGIRVANVADLSSPLATAPFVAPKP
jgi:hypothetical protein